MARSRIEHIKSANDSLIAKGNLNAVGDYFAYDYVAHVTSKDMKGHAGVKRYLKMLQQAFPKLTVEVEILAQGNGRVAWQRTLRGKHEGDCQGFPPTGKRITWRDMLVTRFAGDLIAEEWVISDLAEQLLRARGN